MTEDEGVLYLEIEDALIIYAGIFNCNLQEAADQLRNRSGLESALARPRTYAYYHGADIALQAAVLVHGIAEGQPFIEGNKRTAYVACILFLEENSYLLTAPQLDVQGWVKDLSVGLSEEGFAEHIRQWLVPA